MDHTKRHASLYARIAEALGWTEAEAHSFSRPTLRALVRTVDPALAEELADEIRSGRGITR